MRGGENEILRGIKIPRVFEVREKSRLYIRRVINNLKIGVMWDGGVGLELGGFT